MAHKTWHIGYTIHYIKCPTQSVFSSTKITPLPDGLLVVEAEICCQKIYATHTGIFLFCRHLNGYTYFIYSGQYWRYNDFKNHIDYTYPHALSNWINLPDKIDGLFIWSDGQLYAFSGQYYYQVLFNGNSTSKNSIIRRNISSLWHGVPNGIDAVFR